MRLRPEDVEMLPRRSSWYLDTWNRLTRRERRRIRRTPALAAAQRAWVAAAPRRMNAALKRIYAGSIADMFPNSSPLLRMLDVRRYQRDALLPEPLEILPQSNPCQEW